VALPHRRRWHHPSATALLYAEHGADIAIADIDANRTDSLVAAIGDQGRPALGIVTDLTGHGAVKAAVEKTVDAFGRVDILVNGLGHAMNRPGPVEKSATAAWPQATEFWPA
jgi:2-hydroxycyclohexanecarboxyl-CoA dehydrogenase